METTQGGRLTIRRGAGEVEAGKMSSKKVPCQGAKIALIEETAEAGASVTRVTPFRQQDWAEWTVRSKRPIFKWVVPAKVTIRVINLDS